jgi:hypothetical protein
MLLLSASALAEAAVGRFVAAPGNLQPAAAAAVLQLTSSAAAAAATAAALQPCLQLPHQQKHH